MKDSVFYTWIVVIFIIAGVLFYIGSNQNNNENTQSKIVKENEVETVTNEILKNSFNANATIKFQDMTINADVNKTNENAITLNIIEPKTLNGMELQYDGELINLNYKGMSLGLDKNSKTLSSVANILINSLETATQGTGLEIKNESGGITVNGKSNSGDFSILLNPSTKSIAEIVSPTLDFRCEFN